MCGEPAAEEDAERGADGDAKRIEGQRPRALLPREIIGDQRIGGSDSTRLADRDAHARNHQLGVGLNDAADGREQAPERDRSSDDVDPALAIRRPGDRYGDGRVEHAERDSEMAQRRVRKTEFLADRHRKDTDDVPVDEIEDVGEQQEQKHALPKRACFLIFSRPLAQKRTPNDRNTWRGLP